MLQHADNHEYVESLWVSDAELAPVLREIDAAGAASPRVKRRKFKRRTYRVDGGIQFEVRPAGERPIHFIVRPYDLCEKGAGFLHGGLLAPGMPCSLTLISGSGHRMTLSGTVSHCRRVRGLIHYIGMSFDETLAVEKFCESNGDEPQARRQPQSYDGAKLMGMARELIELIEARAPVHQIKQKIRSMDQATEHGLVINTQSLRPDSWGKSRPANATKVTPPDPTPDAADS